MTSTYQGWLSKPPWLQKNVQQKGQSIMKSLTSHSTLNQGLCVLLSIVMLGMLFSAPAPASALDTGYSSPTAQAAGPGGDGNGFESNPANAFADDGAFAFDLDSGVSGTLNCTDPVRDNHDFFNYGFSIPGGSAITGVEVRLDAWTDLVKNTASLCVQLSADGGASWTAARVTPALTTTEASYLLGGPADTWGRAWTTADLSNANFRVRVTTIANANVRDFSLDWVAVKVYYGGSGSTPTNTATFTRTPTPGATFTPTSTATIGPSPTATRTPTATVTSITPTVPPPGNRVVVGYFAQWAIYRRNYLVKNVDTSGSAERMTHINYAFAGISDTYKCMSVDPFADYNKAFGADEAVNGIADTSSEPVKGNFKQLMELKQKYPHLKILISVGGWSLSDKFSDAALPANRAAFVASCVDMFINGNYEAGKTLKGVFDGIDIDWEYPGACGLTCNFRPEDTQNFTALLAEFRSQLNAQGALDGKYYSLTIAAPAGSEFSSKIELNNIPQYLDFVNLMAYDFHGGWESPMVTGFHSALYGAPADPAYSQRLWADASVQDYLNGGVPAGKLVLGVPFYGRGWTGVAPGPNNDGLWQSASRLPRGKWERGINDYKDLVPLEATYQTYIHPQTQAFYIYNGSTWWSYDNPVSMTTKMTYVKNRGLGGVMFWELSGDNGNLIRAIYNGLQ